MSEQETVEENQESNQEPQPNMQEALAQFAAIAQQQQEAAEANARIGVIGFSTTEFDKVRAAALLEGAFYTLNAMDPGKCDMVSGLTNLGIPAIAYELAAKMGWKTVGYACAKAKEHDCYPVDEEHVIGEEWGDESEAFLADIEILIKVGGGEQSQTEFDSFNGPKWELPL